jgi:hypothetical protein
LHDVLLSENAPQKGSPPASGDAGLQRSRGFAELESFNEERFRSYQNPHNEPRNHSFSVAGVGAILASPL